MDGIDHLKDLYQDLLALSQNCLVNTERLGEELDRSIAEFRQLLDKSPKNDSHRQSLSTGTDRFTLPCRTDLRLSLQASSKSRT